MTAQEVISHLLEIHYVNLCWGALSVLCNMMLLLSALHLVFPCNVLLRASIQAASYFILKQHREAACITLHCGNVGQ